MSFHVLTLYLILTTTYSLCYDETLQYYENLINTNKQNAEHFQLPNNAKIYEPKEEYPPADFGTYDFIIVGAGATGSVIANRLSEIKNWKILLLEAGPYSNNFTEIPAMDFEVTNSQYNWNYKSIPQKTACLGAKDALCPYPRGRGLGGTTLINGLAYVRGRPQDYDRWEALGNPGWSYSDVLPYFKKSEAFHKTDPQAPVDPEYHGKCGYLNVEYHMPRSPYLNAFLDGFKELGYNLIDYNGRYGIGASPAQLTTKHGRKADDGSAFVLPVKGRRNLKVMTNSFVTKIMIDPKAKTADGVLFSHNRKIYRANASLEVIISAGAIASPQLLMLSGIGPKKHLKDVGITVIENLEVGSTLRDHPQYYGLTFSTNQSDTAPLEMLITEYLNGTGQLTIAGPNEGLGFIQTSLEKTPNYPDVEMIIFPPNATSPPFNRIFNWNEETLQATWGDIDVTRSFSIRMFVLHAKSFGNIRLKSSSPYEYPDIDSNFLSDEDNTDINALYEAIQFVLKLVETKPFKKIDAKFQAKPLPQCKAFKSFSKEYWYCSLRYLTFNVYHPSSTCPMGPHPSKGYVVNEKLKVHGIKKLRVADASVFPFTLSGHPNAPCVMIGEKGSDLIKKEHQSTIHS